jgi:hypothetical protein
MRSGWFFERYRHSLAAHGIRTSFRGKDVRELQKAYFKPYEVGAGLNRYELKPIPRGKRRLSKKAELEEEAAWMEMTILDEENPVSPERKKQLSESLAIIKDKLKHIPGRPPMGIIRAEGKEIPMAEYNYYKGTSGRVPDFVREVTRHADLTKPEIERQMAYAERKQIMADMRAEERVLEAIDAKITRLEPEQIEESELIEPDVLVRRRTDINFALKKDFQGQNPRETANFYRYRQEDPDKYDAFRMKVLPSGKEIVFGRKKTTAKTYKKKRKWEVQSILVPK